MAIDGFTRYVVGGCLSDFKTTTILPVFRDILRRFPFRIQQVLLDRQSAFTSKPFLDFLRERDLAYKFAIPHRHGETTGIIERTIGTLRMMSRTPFHGAHLSSTFWRFALAYAIFIKTGCRTKASKIGYNSKRFSDVKFISSCLRCLDVCVTTFLP